MNRYMFFTFVQSCFWIFLEAESAQVSVTWIANRYLCFLGDLCDSYCCKGSDNPKHSKYVTHVESDLITNDIVRHVFCK